MSDPSELAVEVKGDTGVGVRFASSFSIEMDDNITGAAYVGSAAGLMGVLFAKLDQIFLTEGLTGGDHVTALGKAGELRNRIDG